MNAFMDNTMCRLFVVIEKGHLDAHSKQTLQLQIYS